MSLKTLPEPNVDVFITYSGRRELARFNPKSDSFTVACYDYEGPSFVPKFWVDNWDYAVPAGDMLCR